MRTEIRVNGLLWVSWDYPYEWNRTLRLGALSARFMVVFRRGESDDFRFRVNVSKNKSKTCKFSNGLGVTDPIPTTAGQYCLSRSVSSWGCMGTGPLNGVRAW